MRLFITLLEPLAHLCGGGDWCYDYTLSISWCAKGCL